MWLILLLIAGCNQSKPDLPRRLDTVSLLPDGRGPGAIAANPQSDYVYVVARSGYISIFREAQLVATLPIGDQIRPVLTVDPNQGWVYVINEDSNTVTVIRDAEVVNTLEVAGRWPSAVTVESNSSWAYVVSGYSKERDVHGAPIVEGNVTVLSGDETIDIIPLGRTLAQFVTADPVHGYIYVGAALGDVVVIKGLEEVARYNVGATVVDMDVDPHSGDVYVLAPAPDNRDLNRFREGKLVERIKVEGEGGSVDTLQVHPVTGNVYVIDVVRQEVAVVRPAKWPNRPLVVIGRVPVGRGPSKMAIDPVTGNVYVTNIFDNSVTAIQGTTVLTTYSVGWYPFGIGVNPANGWVYVANTNEHSVTVLGFK